MVTRQRLFDPCGLREFLLDSTNTTNLFAEEVINVLANFLCQTPRHRNFLNEVHNKIVNGDHRQMCAQQLINGVPSVVCTPTDAVQLLVDLRVPPNRYAVLQIFMTQVGTTFSAKARIDWQPRIPSSQHMEQAWTQLVEAMQSDYPEIDKEAQAVGISWPLPKVFKFIEQHPIFHQHWDSSMPVMPIIRGDAFPISGTQWSQISLTFGNWEALARNLSHTFGVAYTDDKDASVLARLWEKILKYFVEFNVNLSILHVDP